ncbi:MAG: hypothetical protein KDB53_14165 [Planctomycetes bacterium]|nr:hypothetical protein [Planctomycetota bacterium]
MPEPTRPSGFLVWLLGAWIALTITTTWVATTNFVVLKPGRLERSDEVVKGLEPGPPRAMALRYVASSLNRRFFEGYGLAQMLCALTAMSIVARRYTREKWLVGLVAFALVAALVFRYWIVRELSELGPQLDFIPTSMVSEERQRFDFIHQVSVYLEVAKLAVLVAASFLAIRRLQSVPTSK